MQEAGTPLCIITIDKAVHTAQNSERIGILSLLPTRSTTFSRLSLSSRLYTEPPDAPSIHETFQASKQNKKLKMVLSQAWQYTCKLTGSDNKRPTGMGGSKSWIKTPAHLEQSDCHNLHGQNKVFMDKERWERRRYISYLSDLPVTPILQSTFPKLAVQGKWVFVGIQRLQTRLVRVRAGSVRGLELGRPKGSLRVQASAPD